MTTLSFLELLSGVATTDLARNLGDLSVALTSAAVIMLMLLVASAVITHRHRPKLKTPLFTLIVLVTVSTTLALTGGAIVLNINSATGGPVRWGADYQLWACDNQLDLRDPRGLVSDRIGTPTLYEKNDGRLHYDGTPTTLPDDASLGRFMEAIGGEISDSSLVVPLDDDNGFIGTPTTAEQIEPYIGTDRDGVSARFVNGQKCGESVAELQTFVYTLNPTTHIYSQTKLTHPASYELSHSKSSPPGDCIIIEFAPPKDRTDHLCASYGVRDYDRCTEFGVAADKISSCDLKERR